MNIWENMIKNDQNYDQALCLNLILWIPDFRLFRQSQIAQKTVFKCENTLRVITDGAKKVTLGRGLVFRPIRTKD